MTNENKNSNAGENALIQSFIKNPLMTVLLIAVAGSSGLDLNASKGMEEAVDELSVSIIEQGHQVEQLSTRIEIIATDIVDNSDRISHNDRQLEDLADDMVEFRFNQRDIIRTLEDLGEEMDVDEDE